MLCNRIIYHDGEKKLTTEDTEAHRVRRKVCSSADLVPSVI